MNLTEFKEKLSSYKRKDLIFTSHAEIQAIFREIDLEEVKENILYPTKLVYFEEQDSGNSLSKKYNCYFEYTNRLAHRYILALNEKVIIVTIIKINREWQRTIRKK